MRDRSGHAMSSVQTKLPAEARIWKPCEVSIGLKCDNEMICHLLRDELYPATDFDCQQSVTMIKRISGGDLFIGHFDEKHFDFRYCLHFFETICSRRTLQKGRNTRTCSKIWFGRLLHSCGSIVKGAESCIGMHSKRSV